MVRIGLIHKNTDLSYAHLVFSPGKITFYDDDCLGGYAVFANHGYYEEEQATNTYFIVDVYVQIGDKSMREVTIADDLTGTVNYEMIYEICKMEMKKTTRLIETLAQRIYNRLKLQFPFATKIEVRLSKKNPPLAGVVDRAYVHIG